MTGAPPPPHFIWKLGHTLRKARKQEGKEVRVKRVKREVILYFHDLLQISGLHNLQVLSGGDEAN